MNRNRRAGVEDRWTKTVRDDGGNTLTVPSARHGKGMRWLARYVDDRGQEHSKAFPRKPDAQRWLDGQTAAVVSGTHVAPRDAQMTVRQWCELWISGYAQRASSAATARVHIRRITSHFGDMALSELRPSLVRAWVKTMQDEGLSDGFIHLVYKRLSQVLADAVNDGVLGRNPCSRRTSPSKGKAKLYVATTEQVWAIHDAVPDHLRAAVLLGAFAGLRISEVAGGLRVADVDFMRGIVFPKQQAGGKPLKTDGS